MRRLLFSHLGIFAFLAASDALRPAADVALDARAPDLGDATTNTVAGKPEILRPDSRQVRRHKARLGRKGMRR